MNSFVVFKRLKIAFGSTSRNTSSTFDTHTFVEKKHLRSKSEESNMEEYIDMKNQLKNEI